VISRQSPRNLGSLGLIAIIQHFLQHDASFIVISISISISISIIIIVSVIHPM